MVHHHLYVFALEISSVVAGQGRDVIDIVETQWGKIGITYGSFTNPLTDSSEPLLLKVRVLNTFFTSLFRC